MAGPLSAGTGTSGADAEVDANQLAELVLARAAVLERIARACQRAGRQPGEVRVVAVTKTVPADRIRVALAAGLTTLGENRVQEAAAKVPLIVGAEWHLIGSLQSNKARRAVELFDVIESVDSLDLARRLDRLAGELRPSAPLPVLLQANADADPAKSGFTSSALEMKLAELVALPHLRVDGLMTVGRLVDDPEAARPTFRHLRSWSETLRRQWPALGSELSMGMTDDYPVAVEEGATIVRIGRALFGERE